MELGPEREGRACGFGCCTLGAFWFAFWGGLGRDVCADAGVLAGADGASPASILGAWECER